MPVLVTHGGWDYILPRGLALLRDGLPGARFVGFPDSSHLSHIEEPAAFLAAVAGFLQYVERDL
jgi:pimeloyl-ACP methyl ester carboxylesterase